MGGAECVGGTDSTSDPFLVWFSGISSPSPGIRWSGQSHAVLHFWLGEDDFFSSPDLSSTGQNDSVGYPLIQIPHNSALDVMGHSLAACAEHLRCAFERNEV